MKLPLGWGTAKAQLCELFCGADSTLESNRFGVRPRIRPAVVIRADYRRSGFAADSAAAREATRLLCSCTPSGELHSLTVVHRTPRSQTRTAKQKTVIAATIIEVRLRPKGDSHDREPKRKG